ncbi:MAG: hypothetical protein JXQ73_11495 [Phycisphaerae bacterium]|nr:hypothetical protein [Phycisphaerae bacterium]
MPKRSLSPFVLPLVLCGLVLSPSPLDGAEDSARVKATFAKPPREYASGPLWVWNDRLTEQQIVDTMRDLAGQGVMQVFVHPRPGLMTPYLSKEWFDLWKVALREAERLDMNVWIYDENSYPSGFAGGFVPDAMPESRGKGLHLAEHKDQPPKCNRDTVAVYRLTDGGVENVTGKVRAGESLPNATYLAATVHHAGSSPWYGGKFYVNLLDPGVTEKFLEITMGAYQREIGDQFGKRVPGVFTDEPHIRPAGGLPWSEHLPALFEKQWGYKLTDHLPSLYRQVGDWKRVRHDYYRLLLAQYIEHWGKPYHDYCAKHGLQFTGHYWEHDWPRCVGVPDNMAMYAWHQRPAIDCLMNQYREDTHAQFGNARAVKELRSVANQLGRNRTLCEAYGAGGWDLRFEDIKRIGDWLYVLGVNTMDEHLSYITIRGARKRDHPQSFSYHEPWWDAYHVMTSYFTRLSLAMSSGHQVNHVLVIEPTSTAWMHNGPAGESAELKAIGDAFQDMVRILERDQVEYDIGCEDIIARHGAVKGNALAVGQRAYHTVVIPRLTETLNAKTMDLLEGFLKAGGTVLCCGEPPACVDARPSDRPSAAAKLPGWKQVDVAKAPAMLLARSRDGFAIRRAEKDAGILFHHRRQLADGDILFLVNTSIEAPSSGAIEAAAKGIEQWDLHTGKIAPHAFDASDKGVRAEFSLPPCGSLLLFLSKEPRKPAPAAPDKLTSIASAGPPSIQRIQPNVLVLDYVDITAGGETKKDLYFYQASDFAFKKNGMPRNPRDSAVQFRDELITKTFPADSGFEATYRFKIEGPVPKRLWIVVERPDLYTITCNGKPVTAAKGQWWLDKVFGKIDLASLAQTGENAVTIKASPFTLYHELESAYVLGDFALKATDKGFAIVADQPIRLGPWNEQGHPFYSAGVAYEQTFDVASPSGQYRVALPKWYGSVAKVTVNGKPAGHVACAPWECDVTEHVKPGANKIEVTVIGTLKNTLGPHHGNPSLGTAWPGMFRNGPNPGPPAGGKYSTVGYGLFEPFVLRRVSQ